MPSSIYPTKSAINFFTKSVVGFTLTLALCFCFIDAASQRKLSVTPGTCPTIAKRSNGNGQASAAAGDFRPKYAQNNPVALNVVGTPYQKVPFNPTTKTGNITFAWALSTPPENLPIITRVWLTSTAGVTTLSAIKFGPPPPPVLSGGKYISNYCFYNQNMPAAGKVTLEWTDPVTGLVAYRSTIDLAKNTHSCVPDPVDCKPTVITDPAPVVMACGVNSTATFTASGTGAADIQWQKSTNGGTTWTTIAAGGDYAFSIATGSTSLTVSNSLSHDGELYQAIFIGASGCGNATTKPALLTSKPNPTAVISTTTNFICGTASPVSIPVTLTGTAPWKLTYLKTVTTPGNTNTTTVTVTASTSPFYIKESNNSKVTYTLLSVSDQYCSVSNLTNNNTFTQYETPAITLTNTAPVVCFGTTSVSLPYTSTTASPDKYSIVSGIRAMSGFSTVSNTTLGASPIVVAVPFGTNPGTYDFNLTVSNSSSTCSSNVYPFTITINPPPAIYATASVGSICPGGTVNLTASPVFATYEWRNTNDLNTIIATTATPSFTVNGTTTYQVTGRDAAGCAAVAQVTVTALPLPSITMTPSSASICTGGSVLISATGAVSYSWSPTTGLSSSFGSSVIASPTSTTTYTVTGVSAGGCQASSQVTVTVNAATISVTGGGSICEGNTIELSAQGGAASSTIWFPSNSLYTDASGLTLINPNLGYDKVYAKPSVTTTYQARGTTAAGCFGTASSVVSVTSSPINKATSTANQITLCSKAFGPNDPVVLSINTTIGSTFAFAYSSDGLTFTPFNSVVTISSVDATPSPVATSGTTASITLKGIQNSIPSSFTYLRFIVSNNGCNFPYIIRIYDTNNTSGTPFLPVQIASPSICSGSSTTISTGSLDASSNFSVQWSSSSSATGTFANIGTGTSLTVSPTQTTYYKFTLTNNVSQGQCTSTSLVGTVTVNNPISSNVISIANACTNGSMLVTIDGNSISGATYQWESSTNNSAFTEILGATTEDYIIPNNIVTATTYFRRKATVASCPDNTSTSVAIYPPITGNYLTTPTTIYCGSAPAITLSGSTPLGGTGSYTYSWQSSTDGTNYTSIGGAISETYTTAAGLATTTYYKRIVSSGTCVTSEAIILITVNPNPTITVTPTNASVCAGVPTSLTASGGLNYSWSPSTGLNASTGSSTVATPLTTTTYTVTGTNINNCSATATATISVTASPATPTLSVAEATICSGSSVDLNSYLSPSVTAEWYRAPVVNASYIVANTATVTTAGTYYVFAKSGSCYSTNYATFTLKVNDVSAPTLSSTSLSGCSNVDLTVLEPQGRTGVAFKWYSGNNVPPTGAGVASPTSVGTGEYYLYAYSTAGNCYGPASLKVTVTVISSTVATLSTNSVSVCSPETVNLTTLNTTSANGNNFTWFTSATPDPTKVEDNPLSIEESGTFYLFPYTSGCQGGAASVTVTITETPEPDIFNPGLVCIASQGATISTTLNNTVVNETYQWQISTDGGTAWSNLSNGGVYSGVTSSALVISNAVGLGGNLYRSTVSSGTCSATSESTSLAVEPTPLVTTQPSNVTTAVGGNESFSAVLTDDQTSVLQWQVSTDSGGTYTDVLESAIYSGVNSATLSITGATIEMNGYRFRLKMTNSCADYFADAAVLTVGSSASWTLVKSSTQTSYLSIGEVLNYTITLENTGDVAINTVVVSDPGADSNSLLRGNDLIGNNDNLLAVGEKWQYTASHTITAADVAAGSYSNTATATGIAPGGDPQPASSTKTICGIPTVAGSLSICAGSTTTLTGSGTPATSSPWVSSNAAIATVDASGVVTAVSAGIVTITYTNTTGCSKGVQFTVLARPAKPTVTTAPSGPVCAGTNVTLTSSSTTGNQWYVGGVAIQGATSQTYVTNQPGDYTVVVTSAQNCSSEASSQTTIVVNPEPVVSILQGSTLAIDCATSSIILTASTTSATPTFKWYLNGSVIANATSNSYTATTAGFYKVQVTALGCSAFSTETEVFPAAGLTAPETEVCQGGSVQLTAGVPAGFTNPTFQWQTSANGTSWINAPAPASGTTYDAKSTGYYRVVITSGASVANSCGIEILVNPLPTATVASSPGNQICAGQNFTLTATASGASTLTYQWRQSGIDIQGATASTYSSSTGGGFTVEVIDGNGCKVESSTLTITVNPKPALAITNPAAVCSPSTVDLTASTITFNSILPQGSVLSYWTDLATTNALASPSAVGASGTYYIKALSTNGCSDVEAVEVIVNSKPTVTVNNATACEGVTTTLTATPGSGSVSDYTYTWSVPAGASDPGNVASFSAGVAGTYKVTAISTASSCVSLPANGVLTIKPLPVISGSLAACVGSSATLSATTSPAASPWTSSNTSLGTIDASGVVTTLAPGTFSVTYVNADGCSKSEAFTVVPLPSPPSFVAVQPTCSVATGTISVTTSGQGFEYNINGGAFQASNQFSGLAPGTYQIRTRVGTGCVSQPTSVVINAQPLTPATPTITVAPSATVCEGSFVTLTSSATTGNQWYKSGDLISGATGQTYTATTPGDYTVMATNAQGCSSLPSEVKSITINPIPNVTITQGTAVALGCDASVQTLTAVTSAASPTYQWYKDGAEIVGSTSASYSVSSAGKYKVKVTSGGCSDFSTETTILVVGGITSAQTEVCQGGIITLTSGVPAGFTNQTYQWEVSSNGAAWSNASGFSTGSSYDASSTGFYRVKVIDGVLPLSAYSCSVQVTVNQPPTSTVSSAQGNTICSGETATLSTTISGSGPYSYQWRFNGVNISGATSATYSATLSGSYDVVIADVKGCTAASAALNLTVNALPELVINDPLAVCTPQTVDLTSSAITAGSTFASNSLTYWTDAAATTALSNPAAVSASGTYFIKALSATGCSVIKPVVVSVITSPILVVNNPAAVCSGSTVDLTQATVTSGSTLPANTNFSYWSDSGAINALANPAAVSSTGTYFIQALSPAGCSAIAPVVVTVRSLPVITGVQTVCALSTTTLLANATPAVSNAWSTSNAAVATVSSGGVVTGVAAGNAVITFTDINGCQGTATVTVQALPQISGTLNTCVGGTTTLTGNGTPAAVNPWTSSNLVVASVDASGVVTGVSAGTATITYRNSNGCSVQALVTINALPANPVLNITQPTCAVSTGTITVSSPAGAGITYSIDGLNYGPTPFTALAAGSYTVTAKNSNGCISSATNGVINVQPPTPATPTVSVGPSTTICSGTVATLTATISGTVDSYQWYLNGNEIIGATSQTFDTNLPGAYTVVAKNSFNCSSQPSSTATITVEPIPTVSIGQGSDLALDCNNSSQALTAVTTAQSPTFAWFRDNVNLNVSASTYSVTQAGAYRVEVTAGGCSSTSEITNIVTVFANSQSQTTEVCQGGNIQLTASSSGISNPTYLWEFSSNGTTWTPASGTNNAVNYSAGATGNYRVVISGVSSCSTFITVNPNPSVTISSSATAICEGATSNFTSSVTGGTGTFTYQWFYQNVRIAGATASTYSASLSGDYKVTVTDSKGCLRTSGSKSLTVNPLPTLVTNNPAAICQPGTVDLTSGTVTAGSVLPQGSTFSYWTDAAANTTVLTSPSAVATSGTYYIRSTSPAGCTAFKPVTVTVNATPVLVLNNPTSVCEPGSIDLTLASVINNSSVLPNPSTISFWKDGAATLSLTNAVTVTASGFYFIKATTALGCSDIEAVSVTINALPTLTVNSATICQDEVAQITATPGTGNVTDYDYSWTVPGGASPGNVSTFTATIAGTYSVVITNKTTNCVSASSSGIITVNTPPNITALSTACVGGSLTFTGSGTPAGALPWTSSNYAVANINSAGVLIGVGAGNATITYSDSNGCRSTAPISIDALPSAPVAVAAQPTCAVATGQITVTQPSVAAGTDFSINGGTFQSSNVFAGLASGTYAVRTRNSSGCVSRSTSVVIGSAPQTPAAPTFTVVPAASVCSGASVTLTSSAASGNQWYRNGQPVNGAIGKVFVVNQAGAYSVRVTTPQGCVSQSNSQNITLLPIPDASIAQEVQLAIGCESSVQTLSAQTTAANPSYQWFKDGLAINGATLVNYIVSEAGRYKVQITASGCSVNSAETVVTTVSQINTSASEACDGETITLSTVKPTGFNNPTYTWQYSSDDTSWATATGISNAASYSATVGGYYRVVTAESGASFTACSIQISFNSLPVVTVAANPALTICAGQITTLKSTTAGNATFTYQWQSSGLDIGGETRENLEVAAEGTFKVVVTDSKGCRAESTSSSVVVKDLPLLVLNDPQAVCSTATVDLTAPAITARSIYPANSTLSYFNVAAGTAVADPTKVSVGGDYRITVVSPDGCSVQGIVKVNTIATPVLKITNPSSVCSPDAVDITLDEVTEGSVFPQGTELTYWKDAGPVNALGSPEALETSGTYFIQASNQGCTDLEPVEVMRFVSPVVTLSSVTVCAGEQAVLTAKTNTGTASDFDYSWTIPASATDPGNVASFTATVSGTYKVIATSKTTSCESAEVTATVTINPKPAATVNSPEVCNGAIATLTVTPSTGETADYSYVWQVPAGAQVPGNVSTFTTTVTGTYTVTLTNKVSGCIGASATAVVKNFDAVSITSAAGNQLCVGSTVTLTGSGTAASTNAWTSSNTSVATIQSTGALKAIAPGVTIITYTSSTGCANTLEITVKGLPTITGDSKLCAGSSITLLADGKGGGTTAWSSSNTTVATVDKNGVVSGLSAGTSTITYTNDQGCSQTKVITVEPLPGKPLTISGQISAKLGSTQTYSVAPVPGATAYKWVLPFGWTGTSTTNTITVVVGPSGTIQVTTVGAAGCVSQAASLIVTVNDFQIIANDDDFRSNLIISSIGGIAGNVFKNDLLDGVPIQTAGVNKITVSVEDDGGIPGLIITPEGDIRIPRNTPQGVYTIVYKICEVANPTNCDEATVTIEVLDVPIIVPEGISPQGDGRNDTWKIKGLENYPDHTLTVYNRWGNVVFKAAPYNNDWDGKSVNNLTVAGSQRVPPGTYYWVINLGNGKQLSGYLYIAY